MRVHPPTLDAWAASPFVEVVLEGRLPIPSGRIALGDAADFGARAFTREVPPGEHPFTVHRDTRSPTVAFVSLRFAEDPVARWELATEPDQDVAELEIGETFGRIVRSGVLVLGDADALDGCDAEAPFEGLARLDDGQTLVVRTTARGRRPAYFGLGSDGAPVAFVVALGQVRRPPVLPPETVARHVADVEARFAAEAAGALDEDDDEAPSALSLVSQMHQGAEAFADRLFAIAAALPGAPDHSWVTEAVEALAALSNDHPTLEARLFDAILCGRTEPDCLAALRVVRHLVKSARGQLAPLFRRIHEIESATTVTDPLAMEICGAAFLAYDEAVWSARAMPLETWRAELLLVAVFEPEPLLLPYVEMLGAWLERLREDRGAPMFTWARTTLVEIATRPDAQHRARALRALARAATPDEWDEHVAPLLEVPFDPSTDPFDVALETAVALPVGSARGRSAELVPIYERALEAFEEIDEALLDVPELVRVARSMSKLETCPEVAAARLLLLTLRLEEKKHPLAPMVQAAWRRLDGLPREEA